MRRGCAPARRRALRGCAPARRSAPQGMNKRGSGVVIEGFFVGYLRGASLVATSYLRLCVFFVYSRIDLMNTIQYMYERLCRTYSDIYEHLPTLCTYASKCDSVAELGVRGCVSSWALLYGLLQNGNGMGGNEMKRRMFLNDICECNISDLVGSVERGGLPVEITYEWKNDLNLQFPEGTTFDLVFIDTWHVYGQLKRELAKFSPLTNKYIILHDTTVDSDYGETIRLGWDAIQQSLQTGIPVDEIRCGIWRAVEEFLADHKEWELEKRYMNCNGLTILRRIELI